MKGTGHTFVFDLPIVFCNQADRFCVHRLLVN